MKLLKTLLRENGFTEPNQYYDLILDKYIYGEVDRNKHNISLYSLQDF